VDSPREPAPPSHEPFDFVTGDGMAVADSGSSATVWNRRDPDVTPPRLVRQGFHCPFPEEAELEGDDSAAVVLAVHVTADGRTNSVSVVRSPGQGFDQMARRCLLEATFLPARARDGTAVEGRATVRVVFRR
jgi:TonB family protein